MSKVVLNEKQYLDYYSGYLLYFFLFSWTLGASCHIINTCSLLFLTMCLYFTSYRFFLFSMRHFRRNHSDDFTVNHPHFNQFCQKIVKRITVFRSPALLQVYFSLTFWRGGIKVEFIPIWCRGANPIASTKSHGVRTGAMGRNHTAPDPKIPPTRLSPASSEAENLGLLLWIFQKT